ncbi:signal peptide containing protein [Theileria equi strain WA]|uniref:Signal peptide containing protein n=1 Tax=Theileria equi strain WA TaxID=1537102 RepID=L1LBJ4_THEEQ|nr:signal peptide containing protein [Theileria equi strain WA]EKX72782.1 signal peptide containing protein [Theileria equi strain WA]|eukprot:XP_004832234.1 signal peptide containing protein [Theileria equi strain WA]
MRIIALLWTVCLVRLCSAGCCGGGTTDDNKPITLDIANPDKSKFVIRDGKLGTVYIHRSGNGIPEIFYGRSKLWEAKGGEECQWVEVVIDNKGNGMAYPNIKNKEYTKIPFKTAVNNTGSSSTSNQSSDDSASEDQNGGSDPNLQGSSNGSNAQNNVKQ